MLRPTWLKAFLDVFNDYFDTWAFADAPKRRSLKLKRALFIYVIPSVVACAAICRPFEIYNAGIVLTAVSILTALLFGLLVAVFDAAVNLHRDADGIKNAHNLNITLSDFRASITYEILVAILLVGTLVVALATNSSPDGSLKQWWSVPLVWLGVHFLLVLAGVLRLFKTAFNYLTR